MNVKLKIQHIHFIGIGGVGMCGIAEVLHNLGYQVSGSDIAISPNTQHLQAIGVKVFAEHHADNLAGVEVVVVSGAVGEDNPELIAARELNIPLIPRALMLAELMRFRPGIAVAGTHGKTTTTGMVATCLAAADFDPTYMIGGRLNAAASNAKLGKGDYIVAEADESDASFLYLTPLYSIVTNIDEDHMATYDFSAEKLREAFIEFIQRLPFYGRAFLCVENENVKKILPEIKKPFSTYGLSDAADIYATAIEYEGTRMRFTANVKEKEGGLLTFPVVLNFPGMHSVLNALAAIGVALEVDAPVAAIQKGLSQFEGVGRRFQSYGEIALPQSRGHALVIDDYGHHPVEIRSTLKTAEGAYPGRRIVLVFQPHRYTRTRDLFEDFVAVLSLADVVILTDVYPAGEEPISRADSKTLCQSLRTRGKSELVYQGDLKELPKTVLDLAQDQDLILVMGAGSINKIPAALVELSATLVPSQTAESERENGFNSDPAAARGETMESSEGVPLSRVVKKA